MRVAAKVNADRGKTPHRIDPFAFSARKVDRSEELDSGLAR
jgi:hypothetical protein